MESEKEVIARGSLKQLASALSKAGMLIGGDIKEDMLKDIEPSALAYELIEGRNSEETLHIVNSEELQHNPKAEVIKANGELLRA